MKKYKILSVVALTLLFVFTSQCTTLKKISYHHDNENPCTPGSYQDNIECEYWKKNFPNEYKAYEKRMKKD